MLLKLCVSVLDLNVFGDYFLLITLYRWIGVGVLYSRTRYLRAIRSISDNFDHPRLEDSKLGQWS